MYNIEDAKRTLLEKDCSLVVIKDEVIYEYYNERIIDLKNIINKNPQLLEGAIIADKIIGKVAGCLMIKSGVKEIYTKSVSKLIVNQFEKNNIIIHYDEIVPYIENKDKTGMCPMEDKYMKIDNIDEIYEEIMSVKS